MKRKWDESSPECIQKRCQCRCPPGGQTQMRWWPCRRHPQLLWWHWGCSRKRWQHLRHSAPAHPHWHSSWSWKTEWVKGSSSPCLRLRDPLPSSLQPTSASLMSLLIWQMETWAGKDASGNHTLSTAWVWTWALGPARHPSPPPCSGAPAR